MSKLLHFVKPEGLPPQREAPAGTGPSSVVRQLAEIFLQSQNESTLVNPKKAMNLNLVLQLCFSVCFCLTSIFLRHFSNVGFQLIITALANITFCTGAFYVINRQPDSMSVGACLGSGVVISILSLTTALYWGELSNCEEVEVSIRKYTCDNKAAMRAMCTFAVLLFLLQVTFTVYLVKYKAYVLAASMNYDELPGADESDNQPSDLLMDHHVRSGPYPPSAGGQRETLIV